MVVNGSEEAQHRLKRQPQSGWLTAMKQKNGFLKFAVCCLVIWFAVFSQIRKADAFVLALPNGFYTTNIPLGGTLNSPQFAIFSLIIPAFKIENFSNWELAVAASVSSPVGGTDVYHFEGTFLNHDLDPNGFYLTPNDLPVVLTISSSIVFENITLLSGAGLNIILPDGITVTPLPATLPLFASGLGALGLLGWRRKRKKAAAMAVA